MESGLWSSASQFRALMAPWDRYRRTSVVDTAKKVILEAHVLEGLINLNAPGSLKVSLSRVLD